MKLKIQILLSISSLEIYQALQTSQKALGTEATWGTIAAAILLSFVFLLFLVCKQMMAGDGAVDIDLYATVDEFEPEVAGQVRVRERFLM